MSEVFHWGVTIKLRNWFCNQRRGSYGCGAENKNRNNARMSVSFSFKACCGAKNGCRRRGAAGMTQSSCCLRGNEEEDERETSR